MEELHGLLVKLISKVSDAVCDDLPSDLGVLGLSRLSVRWLRLGIGIDARKSTSAPSSRVSTLESGRSPTASGSSASRSTSWDSLTIRRTVWSEWATTHSPQNCYPCLRHNLLPMCPVRTLCALAEREGFEPSMGVTPYTLSRRAPSASRTPLRWCDSAGPLVSDRIRIGHACGGCDDTAVRWPPN